MAKRKARTRKTDPVRFVVSVTAASVSVGRLGPDIFMLEPAGKSRTYITIEGTLDRPVVRDLCAALIQVSDGDERPGNPGAAIGATTAFTVACSLPRGQFDDLLALVMAGKLAKVDLLLNEVRRGRGILRSVHFRTTPVPGEAEEEGDGED